MFIFVGRCPAPWRVSSGTRVYFECIMYYVVDLIFSPFGTAWLGLASAHVLVVQSISVRTRTPEERAHTRTHTHPYVTRACLAPPDERSLLCVCVCVRRCVLSIHDNAPNPTHAKGQAKHLHIPTPPQHVGKSYKYIRSNTHTCADTSERRFDPIIRERANTHTHTRAR